MNWPGLDQLGKFIIESTEGSWRKHYTSHCTFLLTLFKLTDEDTRVCLLGREMTQYITVPEIEPLKPLSSPRARTPVLPVSS
eukprot:758028-Hanusia_phi.AAC.1